MAVAARADIDRQQTIDRTWGPHQGVLVARMAAVVGAQRALARGEYNGTYILRQALVDLAAIAELVADDLPAPRL